MRREEQIGASDLAEEMDIREREQQRDVKHDVFSARRKVHQHLQETRLSPISSLCASVLVGYCL